MNSKKKLLCVAVLIVALGAIVFMEPKENVDAWTKPEPMPIDIPVVTVEYEDYQAVVLKEAPVFEGPFEEYFTCFAMLSAEDIVHVVGKCDNENWLLVVFGECEGWVRKEYLARIPDKNQSFQKYSGYSESKDMDLYYAEKEDTESIGESYSISSVGTSYCEHNEIYVSSYEGFIQPDGYVRFSSLMEANRIWDELPEGIKTLLVENGWEMYVTDGDLQEMFGLESPATGVTLGSSNIMYVEDDIVAIRRSIVHEVAHAIDRIYGKLTNSSEFRAIYEIEKNTYDSDGRTTDDYDVSNPAEFFAYVFTDILYGYDSAETLAPMAYRYVLPLLQ